MDFLITVIVPVYNVEKYLSRCVNSLIQQTYTNLEIILVNDGSTDNCALICEELSQSDSRIRMVHKVNGGLSSARNAGLDIANGRFIGFVDGDDFVEHDMYEKLLEACIVHNAFIAMCGRYVYDVADTLILKFVLNKPQIWSDRQAIKHLLIYDGIDSSACDKLFHRELFINIRFPSGRICEDVFTIPKIICNCVRLIHIGEPKYFYCHHPGSITRSGFSIKRMDMLDAHQVVADFTKIRYPGLRLRADSFYFHAFLALYLDFYSTDAAVKYSQFKKMMRDTADKFKYAILFNRFIPLREKFWFGVIYYRCGFMGKCLGNISYRSSSSKIV